MRRDANTADILVGPHWVRSPSEPEMQFTQNRIEKLVCPAGKKDVLVFDDEQQGLGIRATANGGKTYIVQYRAPGGLKRRMPIGSFSAISLTAAREAARAIMGDAAKGLDPFADRRKKVVEAQAQAERDALTLDALISQWAERRLSSRRQSYSIEAPRALRPAARRSRRYDVGRDLRRLLNMDDPVEPRQERRRPYRAALA
jgi:hypothetical protein